MSNPTAAAGFMILQNIQRLAELTTQKQYDSEPMWKTRYGAEGRTKAIQDTRYHLLILGQSLAAESPETLKDYVKWAAVVLHTRGITGAHFDSCMFAYATQVFRTELPGELAAAAEDYIGAAREVMAGGVQIPETFLSQARVYQPVAERFLMSVLKGKTDEADALIRGVRQQGMTVEEIYLLLIAPSQRELGRLWQINEISVGQEHYCTGFTKRLLAELCTNLTQSKQRQGIVVVACVGGELHDMGARMVSDFLRAAGWITYYLGQSAPADSLVKMLTMTGAEVLALSCTMGLHLNQVAEVIAAVRRNPVTSRTHIMVGGRAFEKAPGLAERLGADRYGLDASSACVVARRSTQMGVQTLQKPD